MIEAKVLESPEARIPGSQVRPAKGTASGQSPGLPRGSRDDEDGASKRLPSTLASRVSGTTLEKPTALILDEDVPSLMRLFDLVYGKGYSTIGVTTEQEALSQVARRKPEILIEHLREPNPDGIPELVKARRLSPSTRIILLSDEPRRSPPESDLPNKEWDEWISGAFEESTLLKALDRASSADA